MICMACSGSRFKMTLEGTYKRSRGANSWLGFFLCVCKDCGFEKSATFTGTKNGDNFTFKTDILQKLS